MFRRLINLSFVVFFLMSCQVSQLDASAPKTVNPVSAPHPVVDPIKISKYGPAGHTLTVRKLVQGEWVVMNGKKGTFNPGEEVLGENSVCFVAVIVGPTTEEYAVSVADTEEEYFFYVADFYNEYYGTLDQEAAHALTHVQSLDFCSVDPEIKLINYEYPS